MKVFEAFWNNVGQYEFSTYLTKSQSKVVWRAALEWFKKTLDEIEEHDLPIKGQEVLERELEEV